MSTDEHIFRQLDLFLPSLGATHRDDSLLRYANIKREGPLNSKVDIFGLDDNRPLPGLHGVKGYRAEAGVSGRRTKQACRIGNIPCRHLTAIGRTIDGGAGVLVARRRDQDGINVILTAVYTRIGQRMSRRREQAGKLCMFNTYLERGT